MRRLSALLSTALLLAAGAATGASGARAGDPADAPDAAVPAARGVLIRDVEIAVPGQRPVRAYVVRPAGPARPGSLAGVLHLHWYAPGAANQDRTEFLAEATALAGRGAVAVLPQLTFPWTADPVGDARDRVSVAAQVDAVRRAYARLLAEPGVDRDRTAVAGHDYGAMYALALTAREPGLRAAVLVAPDATWANWFDTYWLDLPEGEKAGYRAVFAGLDPVELVGRLDDGAYLQFAGADRFVGPATRAAFAAAAPEARVSLYEGAWHDLGGADTRDDRAAWLAGRLALAG